MVPCMESRLRRAINRGLLSPLRVGRISVLSEADIELARELLARPSEENKP